MRESYKVEHKEKYHISPEKVWSNIKKWWFILALFLGLAVFAMFRYARQEYNSQLAVYEAQQKGNISGVEEKVDTPTMIPATKAELENAYYDLTQMLSIMRQTGKYTDSKLIQEYESLGTQWFLLLQQYEAGNVTVTGQQLYQQLVEAKDEFRAELYRIKEQQARLWVFRLNFSPDERKTEYFSDAYGMARSNLQSILTGSEIQEQVFSEGEKALVLVGGDNWTLQYLAVTNQEEFSVTTEKLVEYLNQEMSKRNQSCQVVVSREMEGSLWEMIPNDMDGWQLQMNNLTFRSVATGGPANGGEISLVAPTYRLLSRGSIIRFGLFFCLGCGILFVFILLDHKVRTAEEFYDLFGESPVAVLKGKDKSQRMAQLVEELSFLCKKKAYSTVGLLYMGKNAKGIAEEVSNGLKKVGNLRVQYCSPEKANELFTCDDILVIYDSEYTTEKQLNNMITSFHQVEANLTGMILC